MSVVRLGSVQTRYVACSQWLKVKISSLVGVRIYVGVEAEVEDNVDLIGEVDPLGCFHPSVGKPSYTHFELSGTKLLIA